MSDTTVAGREPWEADLGSCDRCMASVYWGTTQASGKPMSVDVEPTADGLCFFVPDEATGGYLIRVIGYRKPVPFDLAGQPRYTAHAATCPAGKVGGVLRAPTQRRGYVGGRRWGHR